jgi:histidinol-phosphate/aromatic aminotransferase/cobyric acid decarboxylase-like protein
MELRSATAADRSVIYRVRHEVYAAELGQHATSPAGELTDPLDPANEYLVASVEGELAGFVSITPPWVGRYSVDKYLDRTQWPQLADGDPAGLFEVRLLTVRPPWRGSRVAALLMYAALRWISARGGRRVVAIGRVEVLDLYVRAGLRPLGYRFQSGAVTFELLTGQVADIEVRAVRYARLLRPAVTAWRLDVPLAPPAGGAFHGGASFDAIGPAFDRLGARERVVVADVLDAWFPPAPGVVDALRAEAAWLARSSPPTDAAGLVASIAAARGVDPRSVVVGAGSSDLMFRAFGRWLTPASRVLLPDPTYGEYAHLVERVIGARADRFALRAEDGWRLDVDRYLAALRRGEYDLAVLVNPNNPTGTHTDLSAVVAAAPPATRLWVDEAYLEYGQVGHAERRSLEPVAARRSTVVVCKSLSKVYALSGLRAAYLVAEPAVAAELRRWTPPWAVSLPAQLAGVRALADPGYYAQRWRTTATLRAELAAALAPAGEVTASVANFVLLRLPARGPSAATLVAHCRARGVFVRDLSALSPQFTGRTVRVAVRGPSENARVVEAILAGAAPVLHPAGTAGRPLTAA